MLPWGNAGSMWFRPAWSEHFNELCTTTLWCRYQHKLRRKLLYTHQSVSESADANDRIDISKFRRSMCEGTSSRYSVYVWDLPTTDVLRTIICIHIFANGQSQMGSFLQYKVSKLEKSEEHTAILFTNAGFKASEMSQFQPIVILKGTLEVLGKDGKSSLRKYQGIPTLS